MTSSRVVLALCVGATLLAARQKPAPESPAITTRHVDFPAGGTLHLEGDIGEVTVEGWDRNEMELTLTSTPEASYAAHWFAAPAPQPATVKPELSVERKGNEVLVRATRPRGSKLWVTCVVRVPRSAGLVVEGARGEVHVSDLEGDIHATTRMSEITLLLPPGGQYAIDAATRVGHIYSDFPGTEKRRWLFGSRFVPAGPASHEIYLRAGYGDIIIQKLRNPAYPSPIPPASQ